MKFRLAKIIAQILFFILICTKTFAIDTEVMVQVEGKKRKQKEIQTQTFAYDAVKYTKYDLKF